MLIRNGLYTYWIFLFDFQYKWFTFKFRFPNIMQKSFLLWSVEVWMCCCAPQGRSPCLSSWRELRRMNGSWTCWSWTSTPPAGSSRTVGSYRDLSHSGFSTHRVPVRGWRRSSYLRSRLCLHVELPVTWSFDCWSEGPSACCRLLGCLGFELKSQSKKTHFSQRTFGVKCSQLLCIHIIIVCVFSLGLMFWNWNWWNCKKE